MSKIEETKHTNSHKKKKKTSKGLFAPYLFIHKLFSLINKNRIPCKQTRLISIFILVECPETNHSLGLFPIQHLHVLYNVRMKIAGTLNMDK